MHSISRQSAIERLNEEREDETRQVGDEENVALLEVMQPIVDIKGNRTGSVVTQCV